MDNVPRLRLELEHRAGTMSALVLFFDLITKAYRRRRDCQEGPGGLELVECRTSDGTVADSILHCRGSKQLIPICTLAGGLCRSLRSIHSLSRLHLDIGYVQAESTLLGHRALWDLPQGGYMHAHTCDKPPQGFRAGTHVQPAAGAAFRAQGVYELSLNAH